MLTKSERGLFRRIRELAHRPPGQSFPERVPYVTTVEWNAMFPATKTMLAAAHKLDRICGSSWYRPDVAKRSNEIAMHIRTEDSGFVKAVIKKSKSVSGKPCLDVSFFDVFSDRPLFRGRVYSVVYLVFGCDLFDNEVPGTDLASSSDYGLAS